MTNLPKGDGRPDEGHSNLPLVAEEIEHSCYACPDKLAATKTDGKKSPGAAPKLEKQNDKQRECKRAKIFPLRLPRYGPYRQTHPPYATYVQATLTAPSYIPAPALKYRRPEEEIRTTCP